MLQDTVVIQIPFGNETHALRLSRMQIQDVLSPKIGHFSNDDRQMIRYALANPIGSLRVGDLVRSGQRIVILSEDNSRFARTDLMIEEVADELSAAGVVDSDVTVVLALGSHRKMTPAEIRQKLGSEVTRRFECVNSEFREPDFLVDLGTAPGGVSVMIDRRVASADVRIGVGSIVPHPALGYTGGAKIVYPGAAGERTVAELHLRAAFNGHNVMGVADNPARLEMERWVGTVGLDFIVNSVVDQNNQTVAVVAGDYVKAHRVGVKHASKIYQVCARQVVDMVIASSHRADLDLWQATKAVIAAERIVRDGGTVVLYTPCSEGIGPHIDFPKYCGSPDVKALLSSAKQGHLDMRQVLPLSVGALVAAVRERISIAIVSPGISPIHARQAGFVHAGSSIQDLQAFVSRTDSSTKISVLTHGGECFAIV